MKKFIYRVFCGFFLGLAVLAPGFSGSVVSIALGIYQDIVRIVANPFKDFKKNLLFLLPLGIGAAVNAVVFLIAFRFLFERYEKGIYLLFAGLMAGNLPFIARQIRGHGFRKRYIFVALGACALTLTMSFFAAGPSSVTADGVTAGYPLLILGGLAGGIVSLMPGMSASSILISLGLYGQVLFAAEALLRLDFTYALPFAIVAVCDFAGILAASKGIKFAFEKHPGLAHTAVFGFMTGALAGVFRQALGLPDVNFNWPMGVCMLIGGVGISMLFVFMGKKLDRAEAPEAATAS